MTAAAQALWTEIVGDRPADFFRPGSYELLEQYCELTAQQVACLKALAKMRPTSDGYPRLHRACRGNAATLNALGTKLRLTPQADIERHSGKRGERGDGTEAAPDRLIGGSAVWGDDAKGRPN